MHKACLLTWGEGGGEEGWEGAAGAELVAGCAEDSLGVGISSGADSCWAEMTEVTGLVSSTCLMGKGLGCC